MVARKRVAPSDDVSDKPAKQLKSEGSRRSRRHLEKNAPGPSEREPAQSGVSPIATKSQKNVKPQKSVTKAALKAEEDGKSYTKTASKTKKSTPATTDALPRPAYWLMKAEPESRIEKGKDVKFSIDDLAATDKEPWDGVRNVVARNNMRAMKKGEKAFFYHSNCKIPGIAGLMEIVNEHSTDESAFDPKHPYYDEKSDKDNPKWSLVHVKFLQKFDNLISLKELQKYSQAGSQLADMQVLRMSRLSVSKVSKPEWNFICKELARVDPETLESVE